MMVPRTAPLLILVFLLVACSDSTGPVSVESVEVSPADPSLRVGESQQLTAVARDAAGNALTGRNPVWSSSQQGVATVDAASGLVAAVSPGSTVVAATIEGKRGQVTVTVVPADGPIITSITPGELVPGETAVLEGENFDATAAGNTVLIGGTRAEVSGATATRLEIAVPAACAPTGAIPITVSVGGTVSPTRLHPFRGPPPISLGVGQQRIFRSPQDLCVSLSPATGTEAYLVGLQSVSEVAAQLTPATVRGIAAGNSASSAASAYAPERRAASPSFASPPVRLSAGSGALERRHARWARHRSTEMALREFERSRLHGRIATGASRVQQLRALSQAGHATSIAADALPSVGDTLTLRVPGLDDICRTFTEVKGVVRVVGQRGIWIDDVGNPAGGYTSGDYAQMSQLFDQTIYPTNVAYFGEPTDIDGNDRILILTTKELNKFNAANADQGALGFVVSTDFLERTSSAQGCQSSNMAEIYYGAAPDPNSTLGWQYSRDDALEDVPTLIAHEFAHIIQFGRRIFPIESFQGFPSVWEMEGQAMIAEEVVGHAATGRQPGQNYGFNIAFNPGNWPERSPVTWYLSSFADLMRYFGLASFSTPAERVPTAPEQCGWLSREARGPCDTGRLVYGVPWSLLRWVSDHHGTRFPGGEQELHRRLIDNRSLSGYANIEALTGVRVDTLLAQWAAALYLDDRIPGAAAPLTLPSWNMYDIFERGLAEVNGYTGARLLPRERTFGGFQDEVSVRAASTAYFVVRGSNRPATTVSARATSGQDLPSHMQLWIVRLQ